MKTYRINKNAARLAQGTGFAPELIYNIPDSPVIAGSALPKALEKKRQQFQFERRTAFRAQRFCQGYDLVVTEANIKAGKPYVLRLRMLFAAMRTITRRSGVIVIRVII